MSGAERHVLSNGLAQRLVQAADLAIFGDLPLAELVKPSEPARKAAVAILRELAAPKLHEVRTGERHVTQFWTDAGLIELADEIEGF